MLLTEKEAAERLRCSRFKLRRLRTARVLAFIPGRPVLIDEADLIAYLSATNRGGVVLTADDGCLFVEVPAQSAAEVKAKRSEKIGRDVQIAWHRRYGVLAGKHASERSGR